MAQSPTPGQINAYNGAQGTGAGVIFDALGNPKIVGANMTAGVTSGYVLQSDASGNLSLGAVQPAAAPNWTPQDQGFLAWNFDGPFGATSSAVLTTGGTVYVQAIAIRQAVSVTNIVTILAANGSVLTSGQCFAALYQGAGGALVGVTGDQSTAWGAGSPKVLTMALSGGPFIVQPGIVYAVFWFNGTTGPSFTRAASGVGGTGTQMNAGLAATASRWGTANTSVTTTAPATLGTISSAANAYWVALS